MEVNGNFSGDLRELKGFFFSLKFSGQVILRSEV